MFAGWASTGGEFAAAGGRAGTKSNQSPAIPLVFPQGSAGSPITYVLPKKNASHEVPKPVPNPYGFRAPAPISTSTRGLPDAIVTGMVPRVLKPGGVNVPTGRVLLISTSVLLWICGLVSV